MKKLFIGKLSFSTTESSLRTAFAPYEPLASVKVITDKMTGRPRGFGFIELEDSDKALSAISEMDGTHLEGQTIVVNEARPQTDRFEGGSGRRFGGGGHRDSSRGNYRSSGNSRY